ncbi:MAG: PD40 domain-containing protein [Candidatus Yanofskybacteria bacterium]|nr:PD40 domain-containing protein [Candidatus Yanofskybacteria bacterium]
MKIKSVFLLSTFYFLLSTGIAEAQFEKNKVVYENNEALFYQSEHVDYYHWQDIEDEKQIKYLAHVVGQVEQSNVFLSNYLGHNLSRRPNVVFYKTQHDFAATHIIGEGSIPEGVLAFALPTLAKPTRYILAIKLDQSVQEYDTTITHEMAHIFQFDMGPNILKRLTGNGPSRWIMEGGAEFLANEYNASRTDDLRETVRRGAGANPEKDLPTWLELNHDAADPYTFGPMTLRFVKEKYGEDIVKKFLVRAFSDGEDLIAVLAELTKGAVRSPEQFDETERDHWREKFGPEMLAKPRPYQENGYFRGRRVTPVSYPEAVIAPAISPDGKKIAVLTPSQKYYSVVLAVIPALSREIPEYKPDPKPKDKPENKRPETEKWEIEILTPYLPPKHYEYIALEIQASNLSWVKAGNKEFIAFFAQSGKDHKLFVVDSENRKDLRSFTVPLDNAFSSAFSPDGREVCFSASKNITRDIYCMNLENEAVRNVTDDDAYDENPAFSSDGTKIAYVSFRGSYRKIFLLDLTTGNKRQLTYNAFNDQSPSFSDDGKTIIYTSDEKDGVSNVYTIDLETNVVSQWTDLFGASFTPRFARGENDRAYYAHYWQYSQYMHIIRQKFELFEVLTKKPYRQYVMRDNSEPSSLVFLPERDLFKFELDENQLLNPTSAPEKWSCGGGGAQLGYSTYYSMFGQSYFGCSNILETKQHLGQFVYYGSFRIFDYSYQNQEKRTSWRLGAHQYRMPYFVQFYDAVHRYPAQYVLNNTWMTESSIDLHTEYPLNKFNRLELFSRLRNRSFSLFGYRIRDLNEELFTADSDFTVQDVQMYRFLKNSAGSNFVFGAAYVRDTVLYSGNTWGPFHGNAFRAQVEFAPPLGEEFQGYTSANINARTYRHLGLSSLFAGRVEVMANTRANGDFMLLCGPERLRGCEYGSIVGNQVGYASAELRFPILGTYILGTSVRGFLFADAAYAKFSDEKLPPQKLKIYGFGAQYVIPFLGLPAQSVWTRDDGKWKPSFYITLHW